MPKLKNSSQQKSSKKNIQPNGATKMTKQKPKPEMKFFVRVSATASKSLSDMDFEISSNHVSYEDIRREIELKVKTLTDEILSSGDRSLTYNIHFDIYSESQKGPYQRLCYGDRTIIPWADNGLRVSDDYNEQTNEAIKLQKAGKI
jgi:hypothetical protein